MLSPDDGWKVVDTEEDPVVPLTVALRQQNLQKLKTFFEAVSDPREATYGQYKSLDEIRALVAPSSGSVKRVVSYFKAHGFGSFELLPSGDFLRMRGRVSAVNAALATDMAQWHSAAQRRSIWRALSPYSLPEEVAALVDYVSGVHHFPRAKARFFSPKAQFAIGPNDLRTRYNVTDYNNESVNNTQAVAEFQGQYYSPTDLTQFFQQYVPANASDSTVAGVIGPNIGASPGVEAELDIQ